MKTTINIKPSDYRKLSDEELIRRYTELHEYPAYNFLFERYGHIVLGICRQQYANDTISRSRTEEIFLHMLHIVKKKKIGRFKPWLFEYVMGYSSGEVAAYTSQNSAGRSALTREEQVCIKLFYADDKSHSEIAAETGLLLSRIKELLYSGRAHLAPADQTHEKLRHVLDDSACLTHRQVKEYINNEMHAEECHASEHHLNNCPLCSMAVNGFLTDVDAATAQLAALNTGFLHDYFSIAYPQVHLNSFVAAGNTGRRKAKSSPVWVNAVIAAVVAVAIILFMYIQKH